MGSPGVFVSRNACLLQFSGVLRQVRGYLGEFEVRAVHHRSFAPTALGTDQVLETFAAETTAVVLRT